MIVKKHPAKESVGMTILRPPIMQMLEPLTITEKLEMKVRIMMTIDQMKRANT